MSKSRESNEEVKDMPRGENEAFKKQIGRFAANRDEARAAGRKGGKASTMTMQDFKRIANELDSEPIGDGNDMAKGEALLRNIQNEAAHGNVKAAQYIQNIQMRAKIMKIRAPFTQGGGLRRGCGIAA